MHFMGYASGFITRAVYRVDAGKVELDGAQYLGYRIPLTISQLVWIEVILVGGAEIYRNRERDPETRLYPGNPSADSFHAGLSCVIHFLARRASCNSTSTMSA